MWKKIKRFFTVEARLSAAVQKNLDHASRTIEQHLADHHKAVKEQLDAFEQRYRNHTQALDLLKSQITERFSRIEVCFDKELKAFEKECVKKIKAARKED